jgi:hypothetical protein
MKIELLVISVGAAFLVIVAGCNVVGPGYSFGVSSPVVAKQVVVTFPGRGVWPVGDTMEMRTVSGLPGLMPDMADIAWTNPAGVRHSQQVKITPLPPPTSSSYVGNERIVFFVIGSDTVKVMYHDPDFAQ